ncbi:MAG: glycosyltransferase family 4 protein [Sphingobium sp.]|uniref:glycosyltransferase family 4 protein n=1 Tax=Sphingobium sp. TaxID=1912891 RepID=UPI0029B9E9DB|nr:glycosyltransferase family 4 protein [Sphingobium sp.]MDX3908917.1 glycosyltransferase family 4 protein [Sphingobium sp.]
MRILFIAPQPFFAERGTPIAVKLAVEALISFGHEVDLLTYHEGTDVDITGLRHYRISAPPGARAVPIGFSAKKLICDLWLARAAFRLVRANRYDVIHAVEEAVFIALLLRPFTKARIVYDADSIMSDQIAQKWPRARPVNAMARAAEAWAFRRSDMVLAVCPAIARHAEEHTMETKVRVLPDVAFAPEAGGTPAEDLRQYARRDQPLALYVGNLESYQGFDLLLEAQAHIDSSQRCTLIVIGGTDASIAAYRAKASSAGIDRDIVFLGTRPLKQLQQYLAQADILCSPRRDGVNTPMKIYSYMASGKAILATDIESHRQVLDADTALLVTPTAEAMAKGLETLRTHGALRAMLGQAAAVRAKTEFSLEAFEGRIKEAYRLLAPAPAKPQLGLQLPAA